MRVLVTGANGFVGGYLCTELTRAGHQAIRLDISGEPDVMVDLLEPDSVRKMLNDLLPDAIVHLAGQANVSKSWDMAKITETLNVHTTLNLLDSIRQTSKNIRMLVIGSSDQYGKISEQNYMVDEDTPRHPLNPYAISKCTQEDMALAFARHYNLDVLCTRSFNHIGPGQRLGFVVSDFCHGLVAAERGGTSVLTVGNLDVSRDFTDVRDVARAYRLLLEIGKTGEVYNVGSGCVKSIKDLLQALISISGISVRVEYDPSRMRAADIPIIGCNHQKLTNDTNWNPEIDLAQSLGATIAWWRKQGL